MRRNNYAPFARQNDTAFTVMLDVLLAALPAAVWGVYVFGARSLTMVSVAVFFAFAFDYAFTKFVLGTYTPFDLSPVITGLLVAFALPVSAPLWLPVFAVFFAVVIAKGLFGGLGRNIFNPAAAGICASYAFFPQLMTYFTEPFTHFPALQITLSPELLKSHHVLTALDYLKRGEVKTSAIMDEFYGLTPGAIGEISALFLLLGFCFLLFRRIVHFNSSFAYVMTIVVLSFIFCYADCEPIDFIKLELFTGPTMLFLTFFLNDYTTTPTTSTGRVVFAALLGAGIVGIRYYGGVHYGEYFVLIVMNALTPYIEKFTYSRVFGSKIKKTV